MLPGAAAADVDAEGEVFVLGDGGEGGDEHGGVAVADEEDVLAGAVHDRATLDGTVEAFDEVLVGVFVGGAPVEVGWDGCEAGGVDVGVGCAEGGVGCVGGVDEFGDEDECADDADGESGDDDGEAVCGRGVR